MDKLILKAGIPTQFGESGTFFRILSAQEEIEVRFMGKGWSLDTPLAAGIGINFSQRPTPYDKMTLTSPVDQTIEYFAGFDIADDDRVSGNMDLNGAINMISTLPKNNTWSNNNVLAGGEIFSSRTSRRALTFIPNADVILESGQQIGADVVVEWNTSGALSLHATSNSADIEIMEDFD